MTENQRTWAQIVAMIYAAELARRPADVFELTGHERTTILHRAGTDAAKIIEEVKEQVE